MSRWTAVSRQRHVARVAGRRVERVIDDRDEKPYQRCGRTAGRGRGYMEGHQVPVLMYLVEAATGKTAESGAPPSPLPAAYVPERLPSPPSCVNITLPLMRPSYPMVPTTERVLLKPRRCSPSLITARATSAFPIEIERHHSSMLHGSVHTKMLRESQKIIDQLGAGTYRQWAVLDALAGDKAAP